MTEQNKAFARRFYEEVFNQRNVAALDELCTPDFVDHTALPGAEQGVNGLRQLIHMLTGSFPDFRITVHDLIAEGDAVAARFTGAGTHRGSFMGERPTGKPANMFGLDLFRLQDGRAREAWRFRDDLLLLTAMGLERPPRDYGEEAGPRSGA